MMPRVTTATDTAEPVTIDKQPRDRRFKITSLEMLCVLLIAALLGRGWLVSALDTPTLRSAATVFVAVCAQSLPFLAIGVLISASIAAFVPGSVLRKILPRRNALAVPVAGVAGIALPGCECASAPVAR